MPRICIVYHSAYGHTAKMAHAVAEGATRHDGATVTVLNVDTLTPEGWQSLDDADAIIFGSPAYMGGVTAQFKTFIDSASKRWMTQRWKDKIAAGFTNSGSYCGDKLNVLYQMALNAMQHSMIWVGTGLMPPQGKGLAGPGPDDINRLGSFMGAMSQSANDSPDVTPPPGDLETARLFGHRIADITAQFLRGRKA